MNTTELLPNEAEILMAADRAIESGARSEAHSCFLVLLRSARQESLHLSAAAESLWDRLLAIEVADELSALKESATGEEFFL